MFKYIAFFAVVMSMFALVTTVPAGAAGPCNPAVQKCI